jgi:carboxypeptidase PM20D1
VIKRLLVGLLALVLLLAAVLAANTLRQGSRQRNFPPPPPLAVDADAVARSLATALQARTVSGLLDPTGTAQAFEQLQAHLRARYPKVHAALALERVGSHTLVYRWPGRDGKLPPVALLAHQDVVPIAPGTEGLWKQPPFDGRIEGGFVWGRGALDDKVNVITQLEAAETLLAAGFQPQRDVYLIFGHDEEVGGAQGAAQVVALFKQRGIRLAFVLDEGMAVTEGILPGVARPIALIGLGEKGSVTLKISASAAPGHSSMPPTQPATSAIGRLAAALARLDRQPMPGGIQGAAAELFQAIAPELPFGQRLAMSNLWLLRPVVEGMLQKSAATNAMLRTTTAMTVLNAGNKENVLPGRADALVNFRILPGDTAESIVAHVKRAVADEAVEVAPIGTAFPASRLSAVDVPAYRSVERAIREIYPEAIVAPGLTLQGTDSRHFEAVAEQVYRFMPIRFKPEDLPRLHGTDERIAVAQLPEAVRFYHRLLQLAAGPTPAEGTPP